MIPHNHPPNFGIRTAGCPRCAELDAKPYVLTFKLEGDRKIRRHEVASVREALAIVQAALPGSVSRLPIVKTHGGETVAILRVT
jgi:hypothetical protein